MQNTDTIEAPKRIQRKRAKGWRMPEGAVSVTRPGKWGNPYVVGKRYTDEAMPENDFICTLEMSLELFENHIKSILLYDDPDFLAPLKGKDLACWCKEGTPCHADLLLRLANQ